MVALFLTCLCLSFFSIFGFVYRQETIIANHTYTTVLEQPWFRVPHHDHRRVEPADAPQSGFGQHRIPEDDVFIPPDWTWQESKYLPCMDRKCVCPYFNGKVENNECVLPNKQILQKAKRTELRMLSNEQRRLFEYTVNYLKSNNIYNRLSRVHKYSGVHSGPAFTLWHREFLKRVELVIRRYSQDASLGVPYWDSSLDAHLPDPYDSIIFSNLFLGEVDAEGYVITGPYANWTTMEGRSHIQRAYREDPTGELLNNARIDWLTNNDDINMILGTTLPLTTCPMNHSLDARMLEYSHDYVHFFISGDMAQSHSSSNDVIFILHHSMIDLIFETWRQNKQTREERQTQYPASDPKCFPAWHFIDSKMPLLNPFTNKDALSNGYTDEMYEFAPRPRCNKMNMDCGSEYLFCGYVDKEPQCMSKVKLGGSCVGYEGTDICYRADCVKGKCTRSKVRQGGDPLELNLFKKPESNLLM
ncbi:unnamed protein product [Auanema sp. JU1783]|nr:unnamed protein product [Auanema sp. JU1783]